MVLLIQMKGVNIGMHENYTITGTSGGNYYLTTVSGNNAFAFSAANALQMIKLYEYTNFAISGSAVVTCNEWDESQGHGGILCVLAYNQISIGGNAFLTVAGKGYGPDENSAVTWGTGGAGGAGSTTAANTNGNTGPDYACINGVGTVSINPGANGSDARNNGSSGSANSGTIPSFGSPTFKSNLVMGSPGGYNSTYGGGTGAQGGAKGGSGGTSGAPCSNAGSSGDNGENGETGGNAGKGGRGGGAMVLKTATISITASGVTFYADGNNADNGGNGGNGGEGGDGGTGGVGCCNGSTPVPDGGQGGKGLGGNGGNGGDGGNGGKPGTIWVNYTSSASGLSTPKFSFKGGKGGKGGLGGFGWGSQNLAGTTVNSENYCDNTFCPSSGGGSCTTPTVVERCDPNKAMCLLINNGDVVNAFSNLIMKYPSSSDKLAKFDAGTSQLIVYEYDPPCWEYHYIVDVYSSGDCENLFKKLFGYGSNYLTNGNKVDFSNTAGVPGTCPPGGNFTITFYDDDGNEAFKYYSSGKFIEDLITPGHPKCYFATCPTVFGFSRNGSDGNDGTDAGDGTITEPSGTNDNGYIDGNTAWKWNPYTSINSLKYYNTLIAYPNPATDKINLKWRVESKQECSVTIYDMTGKIAMTSQVIAKAGITEYSIDTKGLGKGLFLIEVKAEDFLARVTISLQ
jgi:hypothetical protein